MAKQKVTRKGKVQNEGYSWIAPRDPANVLQNPAPADVLQNPAPPAPNPPAPGFLTPPAADTHVVEPPAPGPTKSRQLVP
jgi:hypothetical protein